jgi:WD40-like Beta Propeller Repeat
MVIASNGRVAYSTVARMNGATATPVGSSGLYVDDQNLGPVQQPFAVVDSSGRGSAVQPYVLFSPDGKRFAYVKQVPGGFAAVIDGKVGGAYGSIGMFQFSPDSQHYAYVGNRNSAFLVYDGQEMPGEDGNGVSNFVFSQTGGRFAYLAKSAQAGTRMVIDGKASTPFYGLVANSMSFSADGKHYAYATDANGSNWQFIRDGVATNVTFLISFTTRTGPPHIDFPPLIFSGDGTRLAWGWGKTDGVSKDVISIDGQEIIHGYSTYEFPEFSPDSKHFATMIWAANKYSLAMDGKLGPAYDDFLEVNRNVACFLDSHTFRFLGVKNGSVYRVTVNLGG